MINGKLGAAAAAVALLLTPVAHAGQAAWMSQVEADGTVLDDGSAPDGQSNWGSRLKVSGAGKLTVSAHDLGVAGTLMGPLDALSFSVSNSTSLLGSLNTSGSLALDIKGPGEYFVYFSTKPNGNGFGLPLVSWSIAFEPNASAVPLPASVWMLIAGLAWATGLQRKRAKLATGAAFAH
jgi:hypothetical protein